MNEGPTSQAGAKESPLPKSDWIILPAVSVLTIALIIGSVETIVRVLYPESKTTTLTCLVVDDPNTGVRAIPNTSCSQKIHESELTTYVINSCGHRAGMECGPKPADTYRIVMIGSSFNYGMWVPREQSFAALLPAELSRRTGRKVELYNEAMQWGFPRSVDLRFKEVLAAKPDLILWPITPMDIGSVNLTLPYIDPDKELTRRGVLADQGRAHPSVWQRMVRAFQSKSPADFVKDAWAKSVEALNQTQAVFLLQHLIFESPSLYVKQYLMQGEQSEYLRSDTSPAWHEKLASFARYYADVKAQAQHIGAKVVVVVLPERAQAAMISMNAWPSGFDPYKLGRDLRAVVEKQGGIYLDILPAFRAIPNPESDYMPVDGHPTTSGHLVFSELLASALTSGAVPALADTADREQK